VAGIVVLAGGTGGAKLARGMLDVAGHELTVVANPGDDVEIYGAYVSPDPDLVTFWLADVIDEQNCDLVKAKLVVEAANIPTTAGAERRLRERATESTGEIGERIALAREQLRQAGAFDYVVENDDLDRALEELTELVRGLLAPAGTMSRP